VSGDGLINAAIIERTTQQQTSPDGVSKLGGAERSLAFPLLGSGGGGLTMDLVTGLWIAAGLFLLILVPYLVWEIRRGKAHGHTWFTWFKPRGHSDIGPDVGVRYTKPDMDEARGARR